jgi:TatD DNase family protein
MFVDSHCHLNFPELFQNIDSVRSQMQLNQVGHALCVSVTLDKVHEVIKLAEDFDNFYASVGVHPDYEDIPEPTVDGLVELARHPKVVAIGETHIQAAILAKKPLIIHTRNAAEDTLKIMREEHASRVGGVMHCFTESLDVALAAIDLGFYISFSGILTFKNAVALKEVAKAVPLDRILIETDSPYLAPVPYRGKINQPAYVRYIAQEIANLRGVSVESVMEVTTANFFRLFADAQSCN